jgi:hypothetical protein
MEQASQDACRWLVAAPATLDPDEFLKLVDAVGKGRFAQGCRHAARA